MGMTESIQLGDKKITIRELTIKEVYNADFQPPTNPALVPLWLALDVDYPLIVAAIDVPPEDLAEMFPSDLDRLTEAFRKANPFLEKPLMRQSREKQREVLMSCYSALFVASLQQATAPEPGIIP